MKLVSLVSIGLALNQVEGLSFDVEDAKNRPVSKVITLLKDMQKQLEAEQEADEEIYDKMACWCKTNDKEKSQAIKDAEQKISELQANIEENTAKVSQLAAEIKHLESEVAKNTESLGKATALRQKQLAEFNEEEKDLLQSIQALKNAVVVLEKHQKSRSLVQGGDLIAIKEMLKHQMKHHSDMLDEVIAPSQQRAITGFIQGTQEEDAPAYANQSGEIFGILSNMKETFESNLSNSQQEEQQNQAAYEDLKSAKEAEIKAGQEQIDTKTDEMAKASEQLAQDKVDMEDTQNNLSEDNKFLMMLKEKCAQTDAEWEARQKTRHEEISAVSAALNFLSSDDAHDLFTKTFNFVQVELEAKGNKVLAARAARVLEKVAKKVGDPKMGLLAQRTRLDAFTKVKKAIDDMVTQITQQKADEVKQRDFCIAGFHENEKDTASTTRDRDDLAALMDELESKIGALKAEIKDLQDQIAEMQKQLKRAGEDREVQNKEFQTTVADQRATQKLLNQALNVLKSFYEKGKKGTGFLQQGPPPPAGFQAYSNNAGSGGVVAMITQIIQDAKAMEAEAIHDEEDAQKAYELYVQQTNDSVSEKNRSIVSKQAAKATAEGDLSTATSDHDGKETDLEQLANESADLHKSCDFTIKNFDIRQEAMDQEVEALQQAKSILSGANFNTFLQRKD